MKKKKYVPPEVVVYEIPERPQFLCVSAPDDTRINVDNKQKNDMKGSSNFRYNLMGEDNQWD